MPRMSRVAVGNIVYHVINRANGRAQIFHTDNDYRHFESLLLEGVELVGMRILSYCIMPNHWHLVLYPLHDGDMSEFMRWITTTHVRQRRAQTKSVGEGHLYQGTYKSFPIETDHHLMTVIRYVEQNPLRAKLVAKAEDWQWSSLYRRQRNNREDQKLLAVLPSDLPVNYLESVNTTLSENDLEVVRYSLTKGAPYGGAGWTGEMVEKYNLGSTLRGPGRPKGG
ncbi:MAG: transposase [Candidatus Pacebacteria bacterium]|nr:transposase [Candidatus Paceibacterota bacterium]